MLKLIARYKRHLCSVLITRVCSRIWKIIKGVFNVNRFTVTVLMRIATIRGDDKQRGGGVYKP